MTHAKTKTRLAADIGGTFTDVVLETPKGMFTAKVPTDLEQPERGIMAGVTIVREQSGLAPSDIDIFVHGTTLATNALIERKGARTALITTEGFRDSLEIAYESRYDQFDLQLEKPAPLVPRDLRFTVTERMDVRGNVLLPLDRARVTELAAELNRLGIEAVAVGLLHSYANPAHEQAVRALLIDAGCTAEITLSSDVCPEVREYERFMTTVCNSYVQPIMARYLRALEKTLADNGFVCPLFLMTSGGGMTTLEAAIRYPIRLVESGPSGGAVLASRIAASLEEDRVVSFDMGGTTAKICLIDDYLPQTARNFEIARAARFQKGSGMPVRIPVVEMIEIGAGGGSIADVDTMRRLAIGPESAGSVPGAACYGKGGVKPTVTDANVVLGRIDPETFAEGRMHLDVDAARTAIKGDVGDPLDVSTSEAALGITEMVEENMANAARIHSVEHGADLSRYTMIAFGGGGPLHAVRMAEKLGVGRVIVPANCSVGSAVGFLRAPIAYEVVRSRYMTLDQFDLNGANAVLDEISSEARGIVRSGEPEADLVETRTAYMRYVGQGHEIQVPVPAGTLTEKDVAQIRADYEAGYTRLFSRTIPERDIEILSWSIVVSTAQEPAEPRQADGTAFDAAAIGDRSVFLPADHDYRDVPIYWRPDLAAGASFQGPALVAEPQTTTFVTAAFTGRIDSKSNLVLEKV
ncbi:hydantoinase/oxoprolinase family protein [Ponticoccus sp. (in: a-proteobacteria)]|uniref:hydantoinase/oxoprolinase family protein n=1 Tax=Ponticoccus sp. (in: a-proteobacteria) TaxID=1925025 RepID=UPI003AB5799B